MTMTKFGGLLTTLGLAAQLVGGQLQPNCNPLHSHCPEKKALPHDNYYIDFTKETGPPEHWVIANHEVVNFTPKGAEFTYNKKGDTPNMWTDFHMLGGRYDVVMQIAPGQGIISNLALWSDIQDEIDWEFSGNQHGSMPFPPPDGMWTAQTNFFVRGKMWDEGVTYERAAYKPTTQFHTYSVDWDDGHITWSVDGTVIRSLYDVEDSYVKDSQDVFPQTPMKLQLGLWGGGDPDNNPSTIKWAGGEIDMKGVPYTMYVRSVNITNKYPACQYKYKNKSGKISSIDKIQGDCASTSPKRARDNAADKNPFKDTGSAAPYPTASAPASASSVVSSVSSSPLPPSSSSSGYVVSSQSITSSPSASSTSSKLVSTTSLSSSSSLPQQSSTGASSSSASPSNSGSHPAVSMPSAGSYPLASSPSTGSYSASSTAGAASYPAASLSSSQGKPVISASSAGSYPAASMSSAGSYPVAPTSSTGNYSATSTASVGSTAAASLSSAGSHPVASTPSAGSYPVASTFSSGNNSAASTTSAGSHPAASVSSTGGFLSSLSSYIMGTTSGVTSGTLISSIQSSNATSIAASNSTVTPSPAVPTSGLGSVSSSFLPSSAGTLSGNASIVGGTITRSDSGAETGSASLYPTASGIVPLNSSSAAAQSLGSGSATVPGASYASSVLSSPSNLSFSSTSQTQTTPMTSVRTMPSSYTFSSEVTTSIVSTVYSTNLVTITSCAPTVKNCPVGQITTETTSLYTTVCPLTNTIIDGETFSGQVKQVNSTAAPVSSIPTYSFSGPSSSGPVLGSLPTPSLAPSAGTSSSIYMSNIIYPNTTTPIGGGISTGPQSALSSTVKLTTSTVYSTNIYTVTSCAPTVTNCPAHLGQVTTELVSLYTTVCPVKPEETTSLQGPSVPVNSSNSFATSQSPATPASSPISSVPVLTTSTVYTSSVYTVTSCAAGATDCSSNIGSVTTESVALYTTVCPVTETPAGSANPVASETATQPTRPVTSEATSALENSSLPSSVATTPATAPIYTTSTVYSTNVYTVTSCAPGAVGCSANLGTVTTDIIAVSTTVCPVTDEPIPASVTSIPPVNAGDYTTTEITISNTFSNTVVLLTSTVTFIDTPPPYIPPTAIPTANTPGTPGVPVPGGSHPGTTQPCTTLTLGKHFTTVITYASITHNVPASVAPGPTATNHPTLSSAPAVDIPSYTMSNAASTLEMGPVPTATTSGALTAAVPGQKDGSGQCVCPPTISTVFHTVTMTVAETTVTSTQTVEPPFPSSYAAGTGAVPLGTGAAGRPSSSSTMSMSTGKPMRRWFRPGRFGHEHGHGHQ